MNKKAVIAVSGLVAVALVGGTFAYFTQSTTIDNPFNTATYGNLVTEDFNPADGEKWQPGAEVNKDIYAQNTGDRPIVVRVSYQDIWSRGKDASGTPIGIKELTTTDTMTVEQANVSDGEIEADKSVVHKFFAEDSEGKWSALQPDGYYYYLSKLEPGATTGVFLDSVKLDKDVDMGAFVTEYYYTIADKGSAPAFDKDTWKLYTTKDGKENSSVALSEADLAKAEYEGEGWTVPAGKSIFTTANITVADAEKMGYSAADYILRITVETCQATDQAVKATFGDNYDQAIYDGWALDNENLTE